jgi:FKBP-type peptidyl-prolyl cis-trans isomerase
VRRRDKILLIVASVVLLAIGLVACGPAQDPENEAATATAQAAPEEAIVEEQPSAPEIASEGDFDVYAGLGEDAFQTTDSGLRYAILEKGDGDVQPQSGEVVSVHYTGWLEDGTTFDSSVERGQPFSFQLGQQRVIPGWEEGIALLKVGDKARLIIPSELGYGEAGGGPIPPNATLVFDVELLDIAEGPPEAPVAVNADDYVVEDNGLQYHDMVVGDGRTVESGLVAVMDVTMWLADGTLIGSTIGTGQPVSATLDGTQLFPGWEDGLMGMKVGGSRQVVVPPELTLRETDVAAGATPPPDNVIIEIDLLDVLEPGQ